MPHLLFYFFLYSSIPQTTVIKKAPFLLFFVFHMDLQQHSPGDWSLSFFFPGIRFSSFWQLVVKQPLKAEHGKVLVLAGSSQGTDCITALWRASNAEDIFRAVMWRAPDLSCHVLCLWGKLPPSQSLPSTSEHTTLISAAGRKLCLSKLCTCQRIPIFTGVNRALWAFAQPYERVLEIVSVSLSLSAYLQTLGEAV